jgi:hypothetical protein
MKKANVVAVELCDQYGYFDPGLSRRIREAVEQAREEMRMRCLEIVDGFRPADATDSRNAGAREACDRIVAALKTPDVVYKYEEGE